VAPALVIGPDLASLDPAADDGPTIDRSADRRVLADLENLRANYIPLIDDINGLAGLSLEDSLERIQGISQTLRGLGGDALFGEIDLLNERSRELLSDRETITNCTIDAIASLAGAGLAAFVTNLPRLVLWGTRIQRAISATRAIRSLSPLAQRLILGTGRFFTTAAPEAFFNATIDTQLREAAGQTPVDGFFLSGMEFVLFQRLLRPIVQGGFLRPLRSVFRGIDRLGGRIGRVIGQTGDRITQLGGEALIMTLHRLRNAGLIEIGGGEVDWERALSSEAFENDVLQSMMEYVTERPAEAIGSAAAHHLGLETVTEVSTQTAGLADFVSSEDFSSLPIEEQVQRLRNYETSLRDMAALVRADLMRTERIDLETPEALTLLEAEIARIEERRGMLSLAGPQSDQGLSLVEELTGWIAPVLSAVAVLLDGGISLAMAGIRRPGGPGDNDRAFYDYDPPSGQQLTETPTAYIPIGPSGRYLIRALDANRSTWSIGRAEGVDVELPAHLRSVSSRHATIRREVDADTGEVRWWLIDHSTNGTNVDGVRVSGGSVLLNPGNHNLVLGNASLQLQIPDRPMPPAIEPSLGILQRICNAARHVFSAATPRPEAFQVVSHNLARLGSQDFRYALSRESFGGNAGPGRAGINIALDAEGRIVAIGNPQDLSPEMRQSLHEGRYVRVTLSVDYWGRIDWSRCIASDPIPDTARDALRRSVETYNAGRL
jgi:hypothetical protein